MATKLEDHNDGQKDGAHATFLDSLAVEWNPLLSRAYRQGFRHAYQHQSRKEPKEEQKKIAPPLKAVQPQSPKEPREPKEPDEEGMPWVLALIVGFYVMVFGVIFLLLRWIIQRPWRVFLTAGIIGGIAIATFWSEESRLGSQPIQTAMVTSETSVPHEGAVNDVAAMAGETAATREIGLPQPYWTVASLGSFSDGFYQVDLWRDDSSGGQVLGRILLFSEDVSKTPAAGELTDIIGNGTSGSLSFAAKMRGEDVSFVGVIRDNVIEGMFSSTRVPEPEPIVFSRGERQYEENYENRLQWSKSTAELLACCGPGTHTNGSSESHPSSVDSTLDVQSSSAKAQDPLNPSVYEAEYASLSGAARLCADHGGFSGKAFVCGYGPEGAGNSTTTFQVHVPSPGAFVVSVRYANNNNQAMTLSVYVNGSKVRDTVLQPLPTWDSWSEQGEVLTLVGGVNEISYRYDSNNSGHVNLDLIQIRPL